MGQRKLFCEISPLTYKISRHKEIFLRKYRDWRSEEKFAKEKSQEILPVVIYKHNSLIRRRLGNVDLQLQENKAVNLALATKKVDKILIKPGETFSFWRLVGSASAKRGYKEGVTITNGKPSQGVGGGMCQFTNLIHWMVLHTPLEIVEHHHHDNLDLFPDFNRQVPFGTGTSISYNYLDYRFKNTTQHTFQLIVYVTDTHLCGELRCDGTLDTKYHIYVEDERFIREGDEVFREGKIYRTQIDKKTGNVLSRDLIRTNHAKVLYDTKNLKIEDEPAVV